VRLLFIPIDGDPLSDTRLTPVVQRPTCLPDDYLRKSEKGRMSLDFGGLPEASSADTKPLTSVVLSRGGSQIASESRIRDAWQL